MVIYPWDNVIEQSDIITTVDDNECVVKKIKLKEADEFLNKYHYQKTCGGQEIRLGLFYNDILVGLMTFGKARYTKKAQWELLRFCYKAGYIVNNGFNKIFQEFLKEYTPNSVISYCDKSKFSSDIYLKLGMKQIQFGNPRKHYWRNIDKKHITSKMLISYGAEKLLGIKSDKETNNEKILLNEGFEIIKDEGQDAFLYLDESQNFGYIYLTTDVNNGKHYVGQHISSKFDNCYYGSGKIIRNILKTRPNDLKVELLEWCKQNISEKEIFYIKKYNSLYPNGYNLTIRKQWFTFNKSDEISIRVKKFWNSERGKIVRKENSEKMKIFYKSDKGKRVKEENVEKYKKFFRTEEGKKKRDEIVANYKSFCKTEAGKEMCKKRNEKLKELNKSEIGKEKESKRIQALRDFYASEKGKKAKQIQVEKYKENLTKPEYIKKRKAVGKILSDRAKTKEGQEKLKIAAQKTKEKLIAGYIEKVNSMSEEDWEIFLKKHPRTTLKKYRKIIKL